jgi:hypothetical protein
MNDRITLSCPRCKAKLAVDSQHAGKKLKCPRCKTAVPVFREITEGSYDPDNLSFLVDDDSSSAAQTPTSMPPAIPDSAPDAPAESSGTLKFVLIVALVVLGPAIGFLIWDRVARQIEVAQYEKEKGSIASSLERIRRDFELERRKSWRERHHKRFLERINNGTSADLDRLREEKKEQEKEWKEEDFRRELLEATRNR